nr:apolipoprotein N-acyltransferase [Pirellulaceae bacterium]
MSRPSQLSRRMTFGLSLFGGCLLWTAFPPINWSFMAWFAPILWMPLLTTDRFVSSKSPKRLDRILGNSYTHMWLAHVVYWMIMLQGLRLAHWTTHFGWLAIGLYLGIYLPCFVFVGRCCVHRLRMPLPLAAAISWITFEWLRGYIISGFSMACLSHTQTDHLMLIQIADLGGNQIISLLIMLIAGSLYSIIVAARNQSSRPSVKRTILVHAASILLMLALTLTYGYQQLGRTYSNMSKQATVGLIQGSINTQFELTPEQYSEKNKRQQQSYIQQSKLARQANEHLSLLVWPESMYPFGPTYFTNPQSASIIYKPQDQYFADIDDAKFRQHVAIVQDNLRRANQDLLALLNGNSTEATNNGIHLIAGTDIHDLSVVDTPTYNSAILFHPDGKVRDIYRKSHLVMFGEYIPLGDYFPWLYNLLPIGPGLAAGNGVLMFEIDGVVFVPNICFESTVPHLVRNMMQQSNTHRQQGDVMLNLTNDGWFWGSAMLDIHLRCNIMRAVEMRRTNLVAANTGISAWITPTGKIVEQEAKLKDGFVIAQVGKATYNSVYMRFGDILSIVAATLAGIAVLLSFKS